MQFYVKNGVFHQVTVRYKFRNQTFEDTTICFKDVPEAQSVSNVEAHPKSLFANF